MSNVIKKVLYIAQVTRGRKTIYRYSHEGLNAAVMALRLKKGEEFTYHKFVREKTTEAVRSSDTTYSHLLSQ